MNFIKRNIHFILISTAIILTVVGIIQDKVDAGSSVQSLSTDSNGKITASQRDGTSQQILSSGSTENSLIGRTNIGSGGQAISDHSIVEEGNTNWVPWYTGGVTLMLGPRTGGATGTPTLGFDTGDAGFTFIIEKGSAALDFYDVDPGPAFNLMFQLQDDGDTHLHVNTTGDCLGGTAAGNVCSDSPTSPTIPTDTCAGTLATISPVFVQRVGDIVSVSGQINLDASGCLGTQNFQMNLPIARTDGNFVNAEDAGGTFTCKTSNAGGTIESFNAQQQVHFTFNGNCTAAQRIGFEYKYTMTN